MEGNMIKSTNLNIRIDKTVKELSEKVFNDLGINMSTAINMFLHQVIRTNSIPFNLIGKDDEENIVNEKKLKKGNGK